MCNAKAQNRKSFPRRFCGTFSFLLRLMKRVIGRWERSMKIDAALVLFGLAVTPIAAEAGEQSDQLACVNDAMTICGQFIPDRERVASCLISNRSHVSAACRTALTHFDPRSASVR